LPNIFSQEATATLGTTYMATSDKARTQLGWQTRPLQTGMLETFAWIAETEAQQAPSPARVQERQLAGLAAGMAVFLFLAWLLFRRRDRSESR